MLVKRNGIFKTINSNEFGIYQAAGFEKVSGGNNGDNTPKEEKVKRAEMPKLTVDEVHDTDKFVKLDSEESVAQPKGESEVEPMVGEDGCYGGVCELADEEPVSKKNKNKNK